MRIVKQSYTIESLVGPGMLVAIERAGRTCYKSEDKITETSAVKFVKMLIERGHHAMIEHGPAIAVRFVCNRGVSHETVRHRLFSFAQESTRFCNYFKESFGSEITIIPQHDGLTLEQIERRLLLYQLSEETYLAEIKEGIKPQQARDLLLICLKTEIVVTGNPREWRHFFSLRAAEPAHPQMRELACPLLAEFRAKVPVLFDDVGDPDCN